jgi:hypothetical protein
LENQATRKYWLSLFTKKYRLHSNISAFSEYSLTLHANNLGVEEYERKYDYFTPSGRKPAF